MNLRHYRNHSYHLYKLHRPILNVLFLLQQLLEVLDHPLVQVPPLKIESDLFSGYFFEPLFLQLYFDYFFLWVLALTKCYQEKLEERLVNQIIHVFYVFFGQVSQFLEQLQLLVLFYCLLLHILPFTSLNFFAHFFNSSIGVLLYSRKSDFP